LEVEGEKRRNNSAGEKERKRAAVSPGGRQVVGLAAYGGDCDVQAYGGVGWRLEQQRERERKNVQKPRKGLIFDQLYTQFSSFSGHGNPPLFIRGGRWIFCI